MECQLSLDDSLTKMKLKTTTPLFNLSRLAEGRHVIFLFYQTAERTTPNDEKTEDEINTSESVGKVTENILEKWYLFYVNHLIYTN